MEPWPLPKARPISCNDSPAFQRRHMSTRCSAESLFSLPCAINTTFRKNIPMRWCCIDQLSRHDFRGTWSLGASAKAISKTDGRFSGLIADKGDLPSHPFRDQAAEIWGARLLDGNGIFRSLGRTTRRPKTGSNSLASFLSRHQPLLITLPVAILNQLRTICDREACGNGEQ